MSGSYRKITACGATRVQKRETQVRALAKTIGSLGRRFATFHDRHDSDAESLREALEMLRMEHEALLVAEECLRVQLDDLSRSEARFDFERARYEQLFDAGPDGYVITSSNGVMNELNAAMSSLFDTAELIGMPITMLFDDEDAERARAAIDAVDEHGPVYLELTFAGARTEPVRTRAAVTRLDGGALHKQLFWRFRTDVEDVAPAANDAACDGALREAVARLAHERAARASSEAASLAKDRILAMVSHDLRGPLNAMLGWAQVLRRSASDEPMRAKALEAIERNGRAQVALVDDLLDLSRIATGKLSVNPSPTSLSDAVTYAVEAQVPQTTHRGVDLRSRVARDVTVHGDRVRLGQIAQNLLSNALKFTPRGGRVDVTLSREGRRAVLTVRDTGKGIREGALPHVFDCFRQDDRSDACEGLGLGLYITKQLVELHAGTITAQSHGEGCGATFRVELPIADQTPATASSVTLSTDRDLRGFRVLVVADDVETGQLVSTVLFSQGADVVVSKTIGTALATFDDTKPDVVVVDFAVSNDRGADVIRALRTREHGHVPALALSGHVEHDRVDEMLRAGFDVHLAKPLSLNALVDAVEAASRLRATW